MQEVGLPILVVTVDRIARPLRVAAMLANGRVFARNRLFCLFNRYTVTKPVVIGLLAFFNRYIGFGCNGLKWPRSARVYWICNGVTV